MTLQHFTTPQWFAEAGGWSGADAKELFVRYVEQACTILDGVEWVATMNEPNMQAAIMTAMKRMEQAGGQWQSPTVEGEYASDEEREQAARNNFLAYADPAISRAFVEIHHAARDIVRRHTDAKVGWTIAAGALTAAPGGEEKLLEIRYGKEDIFWEGSRGDDWAGVQAYSSQQVDANGLVPHPQLPDNTLVGTTFRPDSLAMAVRHATEVTQGVPILITENGIATADDTERIRYTDGSPAGSARNDRRRHRRARLPALVAAGQLRVGPLGADLRPHRHRPRDVRTHPQAQPRLARPGRAAQRASRGGARVSFPFADVSASPVGDLLSLAGRRALVTGGGRGLGKAIALRLAEAGAAVAVADIDEALAAGRGIRHRGSLRQPSRRRSHGRHGCRVRALRDRAGRRATSAASTSGSTTRVCSRASRCWTPKTTPGSRSSPSTPAASSTAPAKRHGGWRSNGLRRHRQHRLDRRLRRHRTRAVGLRRLEARGARHDQADGPRVRAARHPGAGRRADLRARPKATWPPRPRRCRRQESIPPTMPVMNQSLIGRLGTPDDIARVVLFCASDMSMIMTGSTLLADAGQTI